MNEKFVMPWEERPADCKEVMWRYSKNPVIGRYPGIFISCFNHPAAVRRKEDSRTDERYW